MHSSKQPNSFIITPFFFFICNSPHLVVPSYPQIFCSLYSVRQAEGSHQVTFLVCFLPFRSADSNRDRSWILLFQDTWAQSPCQKHPEWCVDGRGWGNEQNSVSAGATAPLVLPKRLQALSLLLVIPFLNCCSQVIVSSCCSEIFSHRVTITFNSQTKAPLFTDRKSVPKHLQPPHSGGEGARQVRLEGFCILGFLSLSFVAAPASCSAQP